MHRTQIGLEPEHHGFLSAEARWLGVGMVVRRIVEDPMRAEKQRDPCTDLVGAGEGDGRFSGADHDRMLYGDGGQ